jgi:hypothetical protein
MRRGRLGCRTQPKVSTLGLEFGHFKKVTSGNLRPEGAGGLSPGFQPWDLTNRRRRALKGRQIERPNKVEIGGQWCNCNRFQLPALTFAPP